MLKTPPDILITTPGRSSCSSPRRRARPCAVSRLVIPGQCTQSPGRSAGRTWPLLERLEGAVEEPFQRIGLSATQRPLAEIGRFVAGSEREIELVDAGTRKELDLGVVIPLEDMRGFGSSADLSVPPLADGVQMGSGVEQSSRSIWPSVYPAILELVRQHRSTIVFVNNRRLAERSRCA